MGFCTTNRRWAALGGLASLVCLQAGDARLPQLHERKLVNGIRVVVVSRPGDGAVHARLVVARPRPDPLYAPAMAYELIRRCLQSPLAQADELEGASWAELLAREDGLWLSCRQSAAGGEPLKLLHQQAHQALLQSLQQGLEGAEAPAVGPLSSTENADAFSFGQDLAPHQVEAWLAAWTKRLQSLRLSAFPFERDRWFQALRSKEVPWPRYASALLPLALGGTPYAAEQQASPEGLAGIRWNQLRRLAQATLVPENLVLVLVGDVLPDQAFSWCEKRLGRLPDNAALMVSALWEDRTDEAPRWASQRLSLATDGEARVVMALRVPPTSQAHAAEARLLAEVLAGVATARLPERLMHRQPLAQDLRIIQEVPGGRERHLLVIEATPYPGRPLGELEQALQSELMRLAREGVTDSELRAAHRRLEVQELLLQDRAGDLAWAVGLATVQTGDGRNAFPIRGGTGLSEGWPQALRQALSPSNITTVLLEPDVLTHPQDSVDQRLITRLKALVGRELADPIQVDAVVRETVQQFRLMAPSERSQALALLEAKE